MDVGRRSLYNRVQKLFVHDFVKADFDEQILHSDGLIFLNANTFLDETRCSAVKK
jgi:hypothetical protein